MPKEPTLTIRKTSRSKPWCLDVPPKLSDTGKRQRLFFASEARAKIEKGRREHLRVNGGIKVSQLPASEAAAAIKATEILKPYGVDLLQAARFYAATHSETESITFEELAKRYRVSKSAKREKYLRDIDRVLFNFGESLELVLLKRKISSINIAALTSNLVEEAFELLDLTTYDFNLHRRTLNPMFNWAVEKQWIDVNPLKSVPLRETPPREIRVLTNCQVEALIDSCTPQELPFFALAIFAGIRPAEAARLSAKDINLKSGYVCVRHVVSKTSRKRFVEISENLAVLLGKAGDSPDPGLSRRRIERVRKAAVKLLELQGQHQEAKSLREWGHDIMRHTFASNHYAFHCNSDLLIKAMGHTSAQVTHDHYLNALEKKSAVEFWSIGIVESQSIRLVS